MHSIRMWVSVVLMFLMVNGTAIGSSVLSKDRVLKMVGQTRIYIKDDGRLFAFSMPRDPADLSEYKKACGQIDYRDIVVKNNDVDLVGVLNGNKGEFKDGAVLKQFYRNVPSVFVGLTKAGNIECITTNESVIKNYNGAEHRLDYGPSCDGISGITGVKELVDFPFFLGAWKYSGELIPLRPADPFTGKPHVNRFQHVQDPELRAALENPSDHPEYFGMIKPLHPEASGSSENLIPMIKSNSDGIAANAASILENNSGISKNSIDILSAAAADRELSKMINTNSDNLASANTAISDNSLQIISNTGRIEAVSTKVDSLETGGIPDTTYTYSAEYVDTGDFQDVVANVRKERRVNGNIENSSDHLVVLFTNTSEWVYEAIDSGNLKYYTDKPLTSYKPAVYSNGDRATVTGWAIRWDVSKAKHKTWEYMREFKRNGDLEKSNAQRKVSALVFVKKPVE